MAEKRTLCAPDTVLSQRETVAHPVRCVACGATDVPLEQTCPACGHVPAVARLGTTIVGRYAIEALLGQGGFGVVYRAVHLALAQPVALKFLSASWAGSPEIRARFQREAFTLARLRHPGSSRCTDFGEVDGSLFLAMELVEGQTLASSLPEDRPLPDARIVELLDQIGDVLAAAHAAGVVHRDLKPENVMVSHDRVKLLDFGLALMVEPGAARLTRTNAIQGTPTYMSPERCRGRDVGPATDVYALGVMLYELLTGRPPFDGSAALELMTQHAFVDPPPMREVGFRREVHPGLEALARAALAKRAEDRPTIAAFRDGLRRALAGVDAASEHVRQVDARIAFAALDRDERALDPPPAAPTLPAGEGQVVPSASRPSAASGSATRCRSTASRSSSASRRPVRGRWTSSWSPRPRPTKASDSPATAPAPSWWSTSRAPRRPRAGSERGSPTSRYATPLTKRSRCGSVDSSAADLGEVAWMLRRRSPCCAALLLSPSS
ncbi:MAG: serine/threonine protein kinase [Myxococcales bacterium]|nr:serine/threonine protein kinase [Myxococcales bacterium]